MKNLFRLIEKNLKLLIRSRLSALIVILGPLLVVFLAGVAFDNTQTYSISLGAYSSSYNEISNGFIENLGKNQFKVTKYPDNESCIESIKEGASHSCMIFSPDFKLGSGMNNEITFYIDYSKINLVYMVLDTITENVGKVSSELSMNLTTVLLDTIATTKNEVSEKKSTIVALTTKNDEIGKKVDDSYNMLNSLDLSTGLTASSVADITTKKNQVSSQVSNLKGIAEDAVDEADAIIDDIEDEITASTLPPEEKASILGMLNDSKEEIADIESSLNSATNTSNLKIAELNDAISNLSTKIEDAQEKLEQASSTKTESVTNLATVKTLINDTISSIAVLQNSMNAIESSINSIQVTNPADIVNPVQTTIKPLVADKTHLNYIFPVLTVLVIMFTGILLSTTMVMLEKKTTAYFRNFISPTKDITFILATFLTCLILLLVQLIIILGISAIFFGPAIFYNLGKASAILLFCMALFTLAGMLVGYLFNSEETATLGAISVGSIFLLISDVILPLESMPQYVFDIAQYNPFIIGSSLLRKALIHNVPFSSIENGILSLFIYCAAVFGLVVLVQSATKKHYISKYLKKIAAKPEHKKLEKSA